MGNAIPKCRNTKKTNRANQMQCFISTVCFALILSSCLLVFFFSITQAAHHTALFHISAENDSISRKNITVICSILLHSSSFLSLKKGYFRFGNTPLYTNDTK
ncbi:hypothetical protein DWX17_12445 [[Clostridium] innocuum]|nr:hypothetical protein DWX17_12445 [[Clostridium] innocuum]